MRGAVYRMFGAWEPSREWGMGPGTHLRLPGGAAAPWTGMWGGMRDAPCCPFALDICQETRAPGPPVMDIVS